MKVNKMDIYLIIVGILWIICTCIFLWIYFWTGIEPSTLETCVYSGLTGETGLLAIIKAVAVIQATAEANKEAKLLEKQTLEIDIEKEKKLLANMAEHEEGK